ncbi:MAG: hypothetical protein LBF38_11320, partial [Deltaproteobacteria bacterium]|nr:hypothetical protein [Deltaproteobacteria bacterium]
YFGWEERKDSKGAFIDFSSPDEASRYQAEALAYQEKIDNLTGSNNLDLAEEPTLLVGQGDQVVVLAKNDLPPGQAEGQGEAAAEGQSEGDGESESAAGSDALDGFGGEIETDSKDRGQ